MSNKVSTNRMICGKDISQFKSRGQLFQTPYSGKRHSLKDPMQGNRWQSNKTRGYHAYDQERNHGSRC